MAFVEGSTVGALNGTSIITLVDVPSVSTRTVIKSINIHNRDNSSIDLTVQYSDNGTKIIIWHGTLNSGATWIFGDVGEILVLDTNTRKIEAFLGTNPSLNPHFTCSWANIS